MSLFDLRERIESGVPWWAALVIPLFFYVAFTLLGWLKFELTNHRERPPRK